MKRVKLIGASALTIFIGLLGGIGTYAYFNDSAVSNTQTFTAGTVDIDSYRDGFDTIPGPMFYTTAEEGATPTDPSYPGLKPTGKWAPSDTHIRSLIVYNNGSLDAVLKQVKAEIESDPMNMASQLDVAVYKILPKYLPDGTPFAPIPGDDTLDQDTLNYVSTTFNPFILMGWAFGVEDLTQTLIEQNIPLQAEKVWDGRLADITKNYQPLDLEVNLSSRPDFPFTERGALLAFVVHLDDNAGNDYQGATAKFGFTVNATQK